MMITIGATDRIQLFVHDMEQLTNLRLELDDHITSLPKADSRQLCIENITITFFKDREGA